MSDTSPQRASAAKRQRTTRGKGLRTRSGCTTCRTRRVKCSEDKPVCVACQRRGETCVYQPDLLAGTHGDSSSPRPESAHTADAEEARPHPPTEDDTGHDDASQPINDARPLDDGSYASDLRTASFLADPAPISDSFALWATSPESSSSNAPLYSAETASRLWLGLLSSDAASLSPSHPNRVPDLLDSSLAPSAEYASAIVQGWVQNDSLGLGNAADSPGINLEQDIALEPSEVTLFRHFVHVLSTWIDVTDSEHSFAVTVASMALRDSGLMKAILALSARHLAVCPLFAHLSQQFPSAETLGVKYYHQTLQYLQRAMQNSSYLRSEELLATVLLISTYEMLDTNGRDWERHLKGVFWIQRSQLIQGESGGLKQAIWWAWLRQDIWAAFKDRRKILSFYTLKTPCSQLGFWGLVNRGVFLLGQCINYASDKEVQAGTTHVDARISRGHDLWSSLEEWKRCFAPHDRRLPVVPDDAFPFQPIWITPPAASLAVQVYHFAALLLSSLMPALGGLAELNIRRGRVQHCANAICGIAYCTTESAAMIMSIQCLYAARPHLASQNEVDAANNLLLSHQKHTGWPSHDIHAPARRDDVQTTEYD